MVASSEAILTTMPTTKLRTPRLGQGEFEIDGGAHNQKRTLSLRLWECFPSSIDQSLENLQADELKIKRKDQSRASASI
jgi:hypothetical protein